VTGATGAVRTIDQMAALSLVSASNLGPPPVTLCPAKPLMRFMVGVSSAEIIAAILRVLFPDARTALDLTPGRRCFWSEAVPTHLAVHDFTALPYGDESYDVLLCDPPHIADGGRKSIMAARYAYLIFRKGDQRHLRRVR
jgi:hypothetical protein